MDCSFTLRRDMIRRRGLTHTRLSTPSGNTAYEYDDNGNLMSDGSVDYEYDAANRLISSTAGSVTTEYRYDSAGLRVWRKEGTSAGRVYLRAPDVVIAEYVEQGSGPPLLDKEHIYSAGRLLRTDDHSTSPKTETYHHWDHLSIRLVTADDETVANEQGHYPFGEEWYQTTASGQLFSSYETDGGGHPDYAMARYYQRVAGRFDSPDPVLGLLRSPQSFNRYAYSRNDPINLADPTGRITTLIDILQWLQGWIREIYVPHVEHVTVTAERSSAPLDLFPEFGQFGLPGASRDSGNAHFGGGAGGGRGGGASAVQKILYVACKWKFRRDSRLLLSGYATHRARYLGSFASVTAIGHVQNSLQYGINTRGNILRAESFQVGLGALASASAGAVYSDRFSDENGGLYFAAGLSGSPSLIGPNVGFEAVFSPEFPYVEGGDASLGYGAGPPEAHGAIGYTVESEWDPCESVLTLRPPKNLRR